MRSALPRSALVVALSSCTPTYIPTPPPPDPPPEPSGAATAEVAPEAPKKPRVESTLAAQGLSAAALDRAVDPCDDFYRFACGGWEKATEIPDDRSRWNRSFSEIDQRNESDLKVILESSRPRKGAKKTPAKELTPTSGAADAPLARVGRFYASCMDEKAIEKVGQKPLRPLLDAANKLKSPSDLTAALVALHSHGVWAFFDVSAGQDYKDATRMIAHVDQNGLGLPDRDYYLKDEPDKKAILERYTAHVEKMLTLAGMSAEAAKLATGHVLRVETALAKAAKSREERREPKAMYNKIDRAGVAKALPSVAWDAYFAGLGEGAINDISSTSPPYLEAIDALIKRETPEALRAYLHWQVIHFAAPRLSKALDEEDFAMQQALSGQKQQRERWKRCVDATDEALGELLAQPFVDLRFGGDSKRGAEKLVQGIRQAMAARLDELAWMDAATRAKARDKLDGMAFLIGFPDKWKKYDFEVGDVYLTNTLRGAAFRVKDSLRKVGKAVDRGEWYMTPPTVNAYYDPQKNQMVFPAGILQPPFYSAAASDVVNLGAMGMVVGHELTHGFDDEGSQFDRAGNLENWWSPSTAGVFKKKGECVEKQYAQYEPLPGLKLNGKLTLGENIADAGGIELAYRAYRALRAPVPSEVVADGFSEDQQFFLSVGQVWCAKVREPAARMLAQIDPHSPGRFRVNGPLSHMPEFAKAFQCKQGSKMVAQEPCEVW